MLINLKMCAVPSFDEWHRSQKASRGQKMGVEFEVIFNGGSKVIMVDRELGNWKDFIDEMLGN
jgi:hypothetical protein